MTEQEKRENAIEEMAQFMCETGEKSCAECKGEPGVECAAWNEAVRLYDAGYRKADEVRKEIFEKLIEVSKNFDGNLPIGVLKAWAIEFVVEVEE